MDKRDRTGPYEDEEVVEVKALDVDDTQANDEAKRTMEEESIPPFLERDERETEALKDEVRADEVEQDPMKDEPGPDKTGDGSISLFDDGAGSEYRQRWMDIQAGFVDDPQASVRDADKLVEQVVRHISNTFARQRTELESHWNSDDGDSESSTEDLRLAVKRYHTFFDQLLNLKA